MQRVAAVYRNRFPPSRTLRWRLAQRTAIAGFALFVVAGAAVVGAAARTSSEQVQQRLDAVATQVAVAAPDALCELIRTGFPAGPPAAPEDFIIELYGPGERVCRDPDAPPLAGLKHPPVPLAGVLGMDLPPARLADGRPVLVLDQPLADGWTARLAADLTDFTVLAKRLLTTMLAISLPGAFIAALTARSLTRTGLRPVTRLAEAAEKIATTQDLSVRIPADPGRTADEVNRLATAFNGMTAALEDARQRQAQLIADAGHELRTPITSLRTNLELLVRSERAGRPLPADHRADLFTDVAAQIEELSQLVDELVVLTHDESRRPRLDVRLDDIVRRAVERVRRRSDGHRFEIELATCTVRNADPDALQRAVVNLLDNAVKFSPPGSVIRIRLAGGRLTVDDEGPGVAPADRRDAFARFWRADSARALPGSGLGLAIVAAAAASHGGAAELQEAPGGGTRAVLTIGGTRTAA